MSGDVHVRFRERLGGRFPGATRLVVSCRRRAQAEAAWGVVQSHRAELGLTLSGEKTHPRPSLKGFSFLGFDLCSRAVTMRTKSVEKFKAKVREITERSHNLDADLITRLNRVVRGTANYFAAPFSHNRRLFAALDKGIRVRLRSMKFKRREDRHRAVALETLPAHGPAEPA